MKGVSFEVELILAFKTNGKACSTSTECEVMGLVILSYLREYVWVGVGPNRAE